MIGTGFVFCDILESIPCAGPTLGSRPDKQISSPATIILNGNQILSALDFQQNNASIIRREIDLGGEHSGGTKSERYARNSVGHTHQRKACAGIR